jgi:hypothetical protein
MNKWKKIVYHECPPNFVKISREFVEFVENSDHQIPKTPTTLA